jgi:hypothetical protein
MLAIISPNEYLPKEILEANGVKTVFLFPAKKSFFSRVIRRITLLTGLFIFCFDESFAKVDLSKYDMILVTEKIYPVTILSYLRSKNQHCKLIYWMWNTAISERLRLYDAQKEWKKVVQGRKKYGYEIISFDKSDCEKYNLIYTGQLAQFYDDIVPPKKPIKDVFFCGRDKGRLNELKRLAKEFDKKGITYDFWVVPDVKTKYSNDDWNTYLHQEQLPYRTLIDKEVNYDCILELVKENQGGITWRALESLFYRKKLITNFKSIKEYDFYNPENIFILGEDRLENLTNFLRSPYSPVEDKYVDKYKFKEWVKQLLN